MILFIYLFIYLFGPFGNLGRFFSPSWPLGYHFEISFWFNFSENKILVSTDMLNSLELFMVLDSGPFGGRKGIRRERNMEEKNRGEK